jgi:hypothetical protein
MTLTELIPNLQIAIGPVILISGVGLLILSMTNRLGRAIDRSRLLIEAKEKNSEGQNPQRLEDQLSILWRRAQLLRIAITLAAISALLAAILIIVLFIGALLHLEIAIALVALFVGCMAAIIGSLAFFIATSICRCAL